MLQPIISPISYLKKSASNGLDDTVPQMQILKYMGNKRGLLAWLMPLLEDQLKDGDTFLDLFAGTSSVGYALKPKVRVLANDIQEYSSVISRALLSFNEAIEFGDFETYLDESYRKNFKKLLAIFSDALEEESNLVIKRDLNKYKAFCNKIPRYGFQQDRSDMFGLNYFSSNIFIEKKRAAQNSFPYILFSAYYPTTFFSLRQCIEIDSLRYAIEQIDDEDKKAVYLSCLMFALSKCVNSSGHFAEFLNISSPNATKLVFEQRSESILSHFTNKLSEFRNLFIQKKWNNLTYNYDYKQAIKLLNKNGVLKKVKLIYIDTPYSNAQYSRFYHMPETLVKYDYPELTIDPQTLKPVKGGYRNDRVQSNFSQTGSVESAFHEMFGIISAYTDATLAISYSDNSLLRPVGKLAEIARKYYEIIDKQNGYSHSAQGSRFKNNGQGRNVVNEYLLICKRK
jgi:adenine-specific DNA methylase